MGRREWQQVGKRRRWVFCLGPGGWQRCQHGAGRCSTRYPVIRGTTDMEEVIRQAKESAGDVRRYRATISTKEDGTMAVKVESKVRKQGAPKPKASEHTPLAVSEIRKTAKAGANVVIRYRNGGQGAKQTSGGTCVGRFDGKALVLRKGTKERSIPVGDIVEIAEATPTKAAAAA